MQEKDIILKEYVGDNRHFCAFFNGVLAEGRPMFHPEQAVSIPTELVKVTGVNSRGKLKMKTTNRFRDLTKKLVTKDGYIIVAIQNQSTVDYGMPLRVMLEDALEYDTQKRIWYGKKMHKNEKLPEVITIVFYHGKEKWTGPKDFAEMIEIPASLENLRKYAQSYPILVVTPENVDPTHFGDGWKQILEILKLQNNEKEMLKYLQENREIYKELPEDTLQLIFALTGQLEYYKELKERGEQIDMCKAFADHYKSGYRKGNRCGYRRGLKIGRDQGISQGISQGIDQGIKALIETCYELNLSWQETLMRVVKKFSVTEEKAQNCMAQYWSS